MISSATLLQRLELNQTENEQLQYCIKVYSDPAYRMSYLFDCMADALGKSYWTDACKTLKNHCIKLVQTAFTLADQAPDIDQKASSLAEFILRYLIQDDSCRSNRPNNLLDSKTYDSIYKNTIDMDEMIMRAACSHGRDLPPLSEEMLFNLIEKELQSPRFFLSKTKYLDQLADLKDNLQISANAKPDLI